MSIANSLIKALQALFFRNQWHEGTQGIVTDVWWFQSQRHGKQTCCTVDNRMKLGEIKQMIGTGWHQWCLIKLPLYLPFECCYFLLNGSPVIFLTERTVRSGSAVLEGWWKASTDEQGIQCLKLNLLEGYNTFGHCLVLIPGELLHNVENNRMILGDDAKTPNLFWYIFPSTSPIFY